MGAPYPSFVSAVDPDGNEVAGLRPPELLAPLATFTGWNLRHPDQGAPGDLMSMMGSTLPFPLTRDERERTRDPRPSIQERYGDRAGYLARVRETLGPAVAPGTFSPRTWTRSWSAPASSGTSCTENGSSTGSAFSLRPFWGGQERAGLS